MAPQSDGPRIVSADVTDAEKGHVCTCGHPRNRHFTGWADKGEKWNACLIARCDCHCYREQAKPKDTK